MSYRPDKRKRVSIAVICSFLILLACAYSYYVNQQTEPAANTNKSVSVNGSKLEIHVIDSGNADSILIFNGENSLLIDAGENDDGDDVVNYLHSHGIESLDYVIATHPDSDHIGGMDVVVKKIPIGTFIMSIMPQNLTPTSKTYLDLMEALDNKHLSITKAVVGNKYQLGEAAVNILGPIGTFESTNNMSVVCRIDFGARRFLFVGDAEKEAEDALLDANADVKADFIKIGHHGSSSSSQDKFIQAVSPKYAAITSGKKNNYNHPHPNTLQVLNKYQVAYYRCDMDGTIRVISDGETIDIEKEK